MNELLDSAIHAIHTPDGHFPLFMSPDYARALYVYALFSADQEFFPSLQNFSPIFQKLQTLRHGKFLRIGKNGGRGKA
jgi:hypothetical protein